LAGLALAPLAPAHAAKGQRDRCGLRVKGGAFPQDLDQAHFRASKGPLPTGAPGLSAQSAPGYPPVCEPPADIRVWSIRLSRVRRCPIRPLASRCSTQTPSPQRFAGAAPVARSPFPTQSSQRRARKSNSANPAGQWKRFGASSGAAPQDASQGPDQIRADDSIQWQRAIGGLTGCFRPRRRY